MMTTINSTTARNVDFEKVMLILFYILKIYFAARLVYAVKWEEVNTM